MEVTSEDYLVSVTPNTTDAAAESTGGGGVDALSIIYMILGIVGVLDNGLVIIVHFHFRPLRNKLTSVYIIDQSIVDLLASLVFLMGLDDRLNDRAFEGVAGEVYCRLWKTATFLWGCYITSTWNLVAITLDR